MMMKKSQSRQPNKNMLQAAAQESISLLVLTNIGIRQRSFSLWKKLFYTAQMDKWITLSGHIWKFLKLLVESTP
jgi:hypothetical protein